MFQIDSSKVYNKHTQSKAIIRFQDCDPLKHLNNIKYFDYFFNAREDQVASVFGVKSSTTFDLYQSGWVVYQQQIAYVRSALVSEWITIFSGLIYYNENTIVEEYIMTDEHQTHLKAVLWTTCKYIDQASNRTRPHHPEVQQYLEATRVPNVNFEETTFAERIKTIKKMVVEGTLKSLKA
jgi:acyl-CoA thioesterase FadM